MDRDSHDSVSCLYIFRAAGEAGVSVGGGLGGRRAVFLSVHGGGRGEQANGLNLGLFLGYIVPLTCHGNV